MNTTSVAFSSGYFFIRIRSLGQEESFSLGQEESLFTYIIIFIVLIDKSY